MSTDTWAELLEQTVGLVACKDQPCWLNATDHGWYVEIVHVDVEAGAHACPVCHHAAPRHILSAERLLQRPRVRVIAELARWLEHLHTEKTTPVADTSTAPVDDGVVTLAA